MVWIRVLGPMQAEVNGAAADLGGPRQRGVLALLLASRGDVVSVDRMIEDLWRGEPPPRAIASLQAYVSNLRRVLEPDRPPRTAARILVSAAPGYAVHLEPTAVDAWTFEDRLTRARQTADPHAALAILDGALALWRGPAYAEFADEDWARAETARLAELHLAARERHTALTLRTGSAGAAVPLAETITRQHPLHEEGWRLLALALWATGRTADALAALRRARELLADELGLDPGPALVELERAILGQKMEVLREAADAPPPAEFAPTRQTREEEVFVGRTAELGALNKATSGQATSVALVTGEAGSGKSSLLRRFRDELRDGGWLVLRGRCPEGEGAPPAWAWTEALRGLAERVPPGEHADAVASLLSDQPAPHEASDAAAGRFRLHRAVCGWLADASTRTKVAVLLDDLHAADAETLALLSTAAREGVPVLLVVAYRPAEAEAAGAAMAEALAALAGRSPTRVALSGLSAEDVTTLVTDIVGSTVDPATISALSERTGGNPFYVKESARLLASEGALVATSEVPEGVRDVLRRRFARLPAPAVSVLRLAAVVGRESDVDVLVGAADVDEAGVLDALDAGLISGLLTEPAPGRVRFVHQLVRDTLYTDLTGLRRTRWHARVATELERRRPGDLAGLAHHYAHAASRETARLAVTYSRRAAEAAERRYAPDACVALLRQALASLDQVAAATDDEQVELLGQLMRAYIRAGQIGSARETRERAVAVAERAAREDLLLAAFTAWSEPTPWQVHPYGFVDERAVGHLTALLARDDLDRATRGKLIAVLVGELEGEGDPRMEGLADEMAALAVGSEDPWLIGMALCTRTKDPAAALDPAEWTDLAGQLDRLVEAHDLVPYKWFRDYLYSKIAAAAGDIAALERYLDRAAELAETYRMAEPMTVTANGYAMLAHVRGDFAGSRRLYRENTEAMARHGSLHADVFRDFALFLVDVSETSDLARLEPAVRELHARYGALATDPLALVLAAGGDRDAAIRLRAGAGPLRYDYFWLLFATLRAMAVVATGAAEEAGELYELLRPYGGQLAGAGTVALVMRPVAHTLGELAALQGRTEQARADLERAVEVARQWGSDHWRTAAEKALAQVSGPVQVDHR